VVHRQNIRVHPFHGELLERGNCLFLVKLFDHLLKWPKIVPLALVAKCHDI